MRLVYLAGPYTADTRIGVSRNVQAAREAAATVAALGSNLLPVAPHLLGDGYEDAGDADYWYRGTLELMRRCDAVLLLPGWEQSAGARAEVQEARLMGLPVVEDVRRLLEVPA